MHRRVEDGAKRGFVAVAEGSDVHFGRMKSGKGERHQGGYCVQMLLVYLN
jgi:hypothetical protein